MKTGQPMAPRKESWGSRKAPVYMKKAPEENLRVLLWQSPVGERSPAPTSLFLCLYDRGRRHIKKRQKARLSDAAIRDTIIALGNGDTLHKYYTMPSMGMQAKSIRKGTCIQPVPTDGRERAVSSGPRQQRTAPGPGDWGHRSGPRQKRRPGGAAVAHSDGILPGAGEQVSPPPTWRRTGRFSTLP